ncbi:MAG TPA: virulence factor SrfB, partial [Hyphomicrobiaceae bacterium]|nr:virulence factor SrfB [Hyphomicrobiaceae bacterium]
AGRSSAQDGSAGERAGPRAPADAVVTLIPNSGLQFIDLAVPSTAYAAVVLRFLEEPDPADASVRVLHGLAIGAIYHPILRTPIAPQDTHRITGREALEAFRGAWIPLPFLRILKTRRQGGLALDEGPTNWVRGFLDRSADGEYLLTLAIDTLLDTEAREPGDAYPAPTNEDAHFQSSFVFDHESDQLAAVLSEPWLIAWIEGQLERHAVGRLPGLGEATFTHGALAYYMTFLSVLAGAAVLPRLRFAGATARGRQTNVVPVDLVLDVGASRTSGILVEALGAKATDDISSATLLSLRDLGRPTVTHAGSFSSHTEFARPSFGSEALSRRSGRTNAFLWPSLVRIGAEAERIANQSGAADGHTGLASPKRHLTETEATPYVWRFAANGDEPGGMVAGPLLASLTEGGDVLARSPRTRVPALRPRFSRSSLLCFFMTEVLLQAISHINSPSRRSERRQADAPRQLRRIVLTTPLTMSTDARELLRLRVEGAIDLVWQAFGWGVDGASVEAADGERLLPPRPEVRLGFDESMCTQLVYIYDAITQRFQGAPADYFNLMGKPRVEHGLHPTLRIAGLDIGAQSSTLTIVTYAASNDGAITPTLTIAEACRIGGDAIVEAVVARFILPTIERALARAGLARPRDFLAETFGTSARGAYAPADEQTQLRQRFVKRFAVPVAQALMSRYESLGTDQDTDQYSVRLGDLMGHAHGVNASVVTAFDARAKQAGAVGFLLGDIELEILRSDVSTAVREVLRPMIATVTPVVRSFDCDLLLLSGWSTRLGDVMAMLLDQLPLRPDRIVPIHEYRVGSWYPFRSPSRRVDDPKSAVVMGALLGSLDIGRISTPLDRVHRVKATHFLDDIPPVDTRYDAPIDLDTAEDHPLAARPDETFSPAGAAGEARRAAAVVLEPRRDRSGARAS